jgi:ABC-2 type transport system ATP-binding protein
VLTVTGLTRRFGSRLAVDNVSLTVERSEIVALLGPNGAGKTTTLRMMAGLIAPTAGTTAIDGVALTRATGRALRPRIGFLPEAPGLWDRLTVREHLTIYADCYAVSAPQPAIDKLLDQLALTASADRRAVELSKGVRQKVALARALLHEPPVLLLDEPTSGLDPEVTRTVRQILLDRRAEGCAILVSTHNLDEAERLADRIAILQGRLIAVDTPQALRLGVAAGRIVVRVAGSASTYIALARMLDPDALCEGPVLTLTLDERRVPALVRALVAAGAEILEVRSEQRPLEDVYLHLLSAAGAGGGA